MTACCPVCGSSEAREIYRFDPARWIPSAVAQCGRCGLLFKILLPSAKALPEYYDERYAGSDYWSRNEAAGHDIDRFLQVITRVRASSAGTLLDIGCGQGQFLHRAAQQGFAATGVEMNPVLGARARAGGVEVVIGDFLGTSLEGRRFDVITMFDLIEHVVDPVAALRRCRALLAPGGLLMLYTPNHSGLIVKTARLLHRLSGGRIAGPLAEIFDCLHVVFFDARTLRRAVQAAGLDVIETMTWPYDPSRSRQAQGVAAVAVRAIEAVSPLCGGRFRLMMVARADA
jgi:2-polyprenyl-3-methyl-5-hydroxy-6-metoxy-1,4-benzoquinol methylase